MSRALSLRQASILDFIVEVSVERLRMPIVDEIADEFSIGPRMARLHVAALVREGWLIEHRVRALECSPATWERLASQSGGRSRRAAPAVVRAEAIVASVLRGLSPDERRELLDSLVRPTPGPCTNSVSVTQGARSTHARPSA